MTKGFITIQQIIIIVLLLALAFLVLLSTGFLSRLNLGGAPEPIRNIVSNIPGQEFNLSNDNAKEGFDLAQLRQGCPSGRDCIPSIDNPVFVSVAEAQEQGLKEGDVVFGIEYKGETRAYPQGIMNWHEIVNDTIAGDPILITFCPLCATSIGFERVVEVDGQEIETEFGVSGKLVNNNLVMYDRTTETLWQQLGGEAIVGQLVGQSLNPVKVDTVFWEDWLKLHPDTKVLSRETGFSRDYDRYPYGNYESDRTFLFDNAAEDDRLHPKQIVWGIKLNDVAKAYSDEALARDGVVNDTVGGVNIKVERSPEGIVTVTNQDTSEQIVPDHSMWFAWFAFNQDTELFQ